MSQTTRQHGFSLAMAGLACAAVLASIVSAPAQHSGLAFGPPSVPNQVQVYLVRLDNSDCQNSNVPNVDSPSVGGNVWVTRMSNGTTSVNVAITGTPNTSYNFYLKCVEQLGVLQTGDEGSATASFSFPTNRTGNVFAFDMYPNGAPSGNKYQSAQVVFK